MSALEFVLVPFGIIVGFGISEVLGGWGQQIRTRHRHNLHPLQIASSATILLLCLVYLWAMWGLRGIVWSFPIYLLVAMPALALALAAHIARIDTSIDSPPVLEQYFENSRPVYLLLTVMPAFAIAINVTSEVTTLNPPNVLSLTLVRLTILALIASLAWSKNPRYHGAALGTLWLAMIGVTGRLLFLLG